MRSTKTLHQFPPDTRAKYHERQWVEVCSKDEVDILTALSAQLRVALDTMPADEKGCEDESDFRSLWVGMLLGAGYCRTFDAAYRWASFVRYNTQGLVI